MTGTWATGDLTFDGFVDADDLLLLAMNPYLVRR
jgi:hypothetical protein